jgi:hypothetical protein
MPVKTKGESIAAPCLALSLMPVIAFDPGETTGYCLFEEGRLVASAALCAEDMLMLACGGGRFFNKILQNRENGKPITCVVERFTLYPGMALKMINNSFVAAQTIGIIRTLAYRTGMSIVYQAASHAKGLVTDDVLKTYSWHTRLGSRHEKDAARHAVYYLNSQFRKDTKR